MTTEVIEDLNAIVKKLMLKKGVSEYDLKVEGETAKGENYMGIIIFFRVVSKHSEEVFNLVMKTAKRSEDFRKFAKPEKAYLREIFMYSDIFPAFRKFTEEMNPKTELDLIPKVYWMCTENLKETLILENLKSGGYVMHDRMKPWNLEHSLFAMEQYGKYHGISFALKDQKPEIFQKLTENFTHVVTENEDIDITKFCKNAVEKIMELVEKAGRSELVEKFNGFENGVREIAFGLVEEEDQLVITHGDCWNNNFMFKYQDENCLKPTKMCFLDFQHSTLNSPARDLSYNIYTSCDKSGLSQLNLLLETYYSSLSHTIKSLGSSPEKLFTYEQLQQHWKKHSKFGVLASIGTLKGQLAESGHAPDLEKQLKEGKSIEEIAEFKTDNEEYNRRIVDVFISHAETVL